MLKKTKRIEEIPPHIVRWKKVYDRYQRNYTIIVLLGLAAVVAIWHYTNHFWGATALAFALWSEAWYDHGATKDCMDEYEYAYPKDGFRCMFKSWPWFIGLATIAYFICKAYMSWLF